MINTSRSQHRFCIIISFYVADECVTFIIKQAKSLDLSVKVFEISPKKPVLVITWEGTEPEKSSILLNGHMDVVPVFPVSLQINSNIIFY